MESSNTLRQMLRSNGQVWVRHKRKESSFPHWARCRLIDVVSEHEAVIKPIKHGGRLEKVPISSLKLWNSMNKKNAH